jgi:hypothetical protein
MIRVVVLLSSAETRALFAMTRNFRFDDAQHHLRHTRNLKADWLCEAISKLREAIEVARRDSPSSG